MFQRTGPKAFKKDLTNIQAVCQALGNPQERLTCIHIAGTNGKGSVAHMLAAVFTAAGYTTGLYTSPHYRDFRERIKINGKLIPKKEVVRFVAQNKSVFEETNASFFEWTVALAFYYFAAEKVDIAIIETGLGGRLDSTNIITPLLSVITNIGFDHVQFLGNTLPKIAAEKAGIIKPNIPALIGERQMETTDVFEQTAHQKKAPLYFAQELCLVERFSENSTHAHYRIEFKKSDTHLFNDLQLDEINLEHLAHYQQKNLRTSIAALIVFKKYYPDWFSNNFEKSLAAGFSQLKLFSNYLGRWEYISYDPKILVDSAHNEDGIRQLVAELKSMTFNRLHFVLGVVKDKTHEKVFNQLPKNATYYFAKAKIPRGMDAKILQMLAAKYGLKGKPYSSIRRALAAAKTSFKEGDLIFVGGSIFTVAEVV